MFLSQGLCLRHTRQCLMKGSVWKTQLVPSGPMEGTHMGTGWEDAGRVEQAGL